MSLTEELQKLDQFRREGMLTDQEFSEAKNLLLAPRAPTPNVDLAEVVESHLSHLQYLNELERIDREWGIKRQQYEVVAGNGCRYIPSVGEGFARVLMGGLLGSLWTAGTLAMANAMSSLSDVPVLGDLSNFVYVLPAFGVFFTLKAVIGGISNCIIAVNYQSAYRAYQIQHRRAEAV